MAAVHTAVVIRGVGFGTPQVYPALLLLTTVSFDHIRLTDLASFEGSDKLADHQPSSWLD